MQPDQQFWENLFPPSGTDRTEARIKMISLKKKGRPLLLLPEQKSAAAATFALYPAQTGKARFLRAGLQKSVALGIPVGCAVELTLSERDGFIHFLSAVATGGSPHAPTIGAPTMGVLAGNPASPSQRFMILLFNHRQQPVAVVKTGLTPEARDLIVREIRFLQTAPTNQPGLPHLQGTFRDDRLAAFALDFFPGDSPRTSESERAAELLSTWLTTNGTSPLHEFEEWQALERAIPADVRASVGCDEIRNHLVRPSLYHGDFAPWNVKVSPAGAWTVLDWERGQVRGIPGWDWFHYFLQSAILVEKLDGQALVARAREILHSSRFQNYARAAHIDGIERPLMVAYLLHTAEVIKPSEGRQQTDRLWRALIKRNGELTL